MKALNAPIFTRLYDAAAVSISVKEGADRPRVGLKWDRMAE